ncbi:MarR family transcriptional regulator [Streptococcus sp. X16XC17]|uniref:MarR family winged helix-turn-helix transcriptional regulator n=1 Tax=unclassified Streptococcus TaxID=2608887 RepID=UPI00066FEC43|nr:MULTISPECIES: MarR family transcriptional regulator [unclassified Streptococcus]TCD46209.1 MarR family transcriptional regulator [Streptococcus sp. X16XC17]
MEEKLSISVLIKRASLQLEKQANAMLAPLDLTTSQCKILKYLYRQPNLSVNQKQIEDQFSMTNPTVTGIIQNLEKKELVYRQPNPDDARSKVLGLTSDSLALKSELDHIWQTIDNQFTNPLTDEQKEVLRHLLTKLAEE